MADEKQYLISMLAQMQGDKLVIRSLKTMNQKTNNLTGTTKKASIATKTFAQNLARIAKRALLTVPVWLVLRATLNLVLGTIKDLITTHFKLEEELARIKTVVSSSSTSIETDMIRIKSVILEASAGTRVPLNQVAEAFYFLRTAGLDTEESLAGLEPALNVIVGTGGNVKEVVRALTGTYNTLGDTIDGVVTPAEKFAKISDTLTFVYASQDVQMGELIQSYSKIAPFLSGTSDSFSDIATVLGFLNTRMLRAGRTGRLVARSLIQLIKNSDKLAESFGITFDPDEPINLINTLRQLNAVIGDGAEISAKHQKALIDIFQTRGVTPIQLLLKDFSELEQALKLTNSNAEGFAEKMREIRESTAPAQFERTKNILRIMFEEFVTGASGTASLGKALRELNDTLEDMIPNIRTNAQLIGFLVSNIDRLASSTGVDIFEQMRKGAFETALRVTGMKNSFQVLEIIINKFKKSKAFEDYNKDIKVAEARTENEIKLVKKFGMTNKEARELTVDALKKEEIRSKAIVGLLKMQGVSELAIANFKLKTLKEVEGLHTAEAFRLKLMKAQLEITAKEAELRKDLTDKFGKAEVQLAKAMGATELEVLEIKKEQFELIRGQLDSEEQLVRLAELQLATEIAITNEKRNRNKASGETVKLFKIAQTEGVNTAKKIAEVLRGERKFKKLGTEDTGVFEEFFGSEAEQIKAREFFRRGTGRRVPIKEEGLRPGVGLEDLQKQLQPIKKPVRQLINISNTIPVNVKTEIKVSLKSAEIIDAVIAKVVSSLKAEKAKVNKAVEKAVDGFK